MQWCRLAALADEEQLPTRCFQLLGEAPLIRLTEGLKCCDEVNNVTLANHFTYEAFKLF